MANRCPNRSDDRGQAGYTLVELIFSVLFMSIFMGQIILAFIWSQRVYKDTIAICEMTTVSRMFRERALYHLLPNGGIASANLDTCSVSEDGKELEFSVGQDEASYLLSYDPDSGRNGLDLAISSTGFPDESLLSRLSTKSVRIEDDAFFYLLRLKNNERVPRRVRHGGKKDDGPYRLCGDFELVLESGDSTYHRGCHIRVPIVNDHQ